MIAVIYDVEAKLKIAANVLPEKFYRREPPNFL